MKVSHLDIHGLAHVKVQSSTRHLLGAVNNPLGYFCRDAAPDGAVAGGSGEPLALDVTIGDKPGADNKPLAIEATFSSEFTLGAGEYLAVFCLQAPRASADSDLAGGDMTVQVFTRREVA